VIYRLKVVFHNIRGAENMDMEHRISNEMPQNSLSKKEGVGSHGFVRSKTSLRLKYEAEAKVVQQKIGDLESIRNRLGLSQRKICQLLLVDPSAWTRWTQSESAPPHIFRALEWYLTLVDQNPGFHELAKARSESHREMKQITESSFRHLQNQIEKQKELITTLRWAFVLCLFVTSATLIFVTIK
jgi:hypothetical protein